MATKQRLSTLITIGGALSSNFKSALGSTQKQLRGVGASIRELNQRQQRLGKVAAHWEKMGRDASKYRAELGRVNRELKRQHSIKNTLGALKSNKEVRAEKGRQLVGAVGIGAAMFTAPIMAAANFEQAMAKVGAISRASDADLKQMTATARELGAKTNWSASQAAEGMQYLSMAGFSAQDSIKSMPGMLSLASAGGIELGAAADIASNILSGFNLEAAEMGRLGDVLTNTFTSSNTDLNMLGETMKYVAPVAAATGVSLEQAAAMAGKLGDAGIQASQAGTSMRAIINRLAAPTGKSAQVLEQLGIKTLDANGNLRDLPEILKDLDKAMAGFGSGARAEMTSTIFGLEAASAATVLLNQAGKDNLQNYADKLKETGSAARVAKEQNDTFFGATKRLGSALESAGITIGSKLLPPLAATAEAFASMIGKVVAASEKYPALAKVVVGATFAFVGFKIASLAGAYAMTFFKGALLKTRLAAFKVGGALKAVGLGIRALGLAVAANPIGIAIGVIGLAAAALLSQWQPVQTFFLNMWGFIQEQWAPIGDWFKGVWDSVYQSCKPFFDWFSEKITLVGDAYQELKSLFGFGDEEDDRVLEPGKTLARKEQGLVNNPDTLISNRLPERVAAKPSSSSQNIITHAPVNNITIHQQPGQSPQALLDEIERRQRDKQQRALFDTGEFNYGF
jgi:TP901 family phage tail tape measure protein